ncbi:hypothetical protein PIB30_059615 [Stylosanthes scabra]|uniref:RRM domain-containing protein n=1 Tax=Stylosanthes scabra TaxID=79078 RepID=A0ABU6RKB6_9FABA|nr:hypothetical protein [Stylosanthes scabra]
MGKRRGTHSHWYPFPSIIESPQVVYAKLMRERVEVHKMREEMAAYYDHMQAGPIRRVGNTVRAPVIPEEEIKVRVGVGLYQVDGGVTNKGWFWPQKVARARLGVDENVDNLPTGVSKRQLYKDFGRDGYVTDIFVSRKLRMKANGPFAFIRFQRYGGVMRAIRRSNGTLWGGGKLFITLSKFKREDDKRRGVPVGKLEQRMGPRTIRKWVEVKKTVQKDDKEECAHAERKEESMDVGPYRCLITFSSSEIRDGAMENVLLMSVFDENRPH